MNIAIVDNGTDCLEQLVSLCRLHGDSPMVIPSTSFMDYDLSGFDLVILSGGWWYDDPIEQEMNYRDQIKHIARTDTPVVGICLGMQLMVCAFGGHVAPLRAPVYGKKRIRLTPQGEALLGWGRELEVFGNHTMGATDLPAQLEALAVSDDGVEVLRHRRLSILGVQFHPEMDEEVSVERWKKLLELVTHRQDSDPGADKPAAYSPL